MKLLLPAILVTFFMAARAQKATSFQWWSESEHRSFAGVYGGAAAAASHFSNQYASNLLFDSRLDDRKVMDQRSRLSTDDNRAGGDYELAFAARLGMKDARHALLIKLSDVIHADARVSASAFDLLMYGNKPFSGDTVQLSSMDLYYTRFQQAGLGWAFRPDPGTEFFAMLHYVNGEQLIDAQFERGWLYTSPLGDTLSAEATGRYVQSDTGNIGFGRPNGAGASLDIGFTKKIDGPGASWFLNVAAGNLGMIQWKPASLHVDADSSIEFTGIALGDFRTVDERFGQGQLEDSLGSGFEKALGRGVYNRWLPAWFQAGIMQHKEKGMEVGGGLSARWRSNYHPFGWFICGYRFNSLIAAHADFGYGGYGRLQVALQGSLNHQRYGVQVRVGNIESFVMPSRFGGVSAAIGGRYCF